MRQHQWFLAAAGRAVGPLREPVRLGDFWLPQRGLFAFADGLFEPYDSSRHHQVASRHEL